MTHKNKHMEKSAIQLLEEATHLLRIYPARLLLPYYIGTIPFALGFLFFWADMSRNPFAIDDLAASCSGLTLLFVWMKSWQSVYASAVYAAAGNTKNQPWSFRAVIRLIFVQTSIQATGFILLPLALLITIPAAWAFAFYQNILVQDYTKRTDLRSLVKKSIHLAGLWPKENHLILLILSGFSIFLLINAASAVYLLPHAFKILLGVETRFTLSGMNVLNTTFFAASILLTHLCLDPIIKAVYALRSYYGVSLTTGEDIYNQLRVLKKGLPLLVLGLMIMGISGYSSPAIAASPQNTNGNQSLSPDRLEQAIQTVIHTKEFAWRSVPKKQAPKKTLSKGPFYLLLGWIKTNVQNLYEWIKDWLKKVWEWLEKLVPKPAETKNKSEQKNRSSLSYYLYALFGILTAVLILFLQKVLRKKTIQPDIRNEIHTITPDLNDETVTAGDLPTAGWIATAKEMLEKQDYRLALRALYLSILSCLGDYSLITIAGHKSNNDYKAELSRRAHEKKTLITLFHECVVCFEKAWYGMHEVTREDISLFEEKHQRITAIAE